MLIKIPPWDVLVDKFGLDRDGDIGDGDFQWYAEDDALLPTDRIIEVKDGADAFSDLGIVNSIFRTGTIFKELFAMCEIISPYGSTKFLRRPYGTD